MFTRSIRWRMQLWLAFLLVAILSGFGITAYQLQRINRLSLIDDELERRVAALGADVRAPLPFSPLIGRGPFEPDRGPEGRGFDPGPPRRPGGFDPGRDGLAPGPRRRGPEPKGYRGWPEFFEHREVRLSPPTEQLFDQNDTNGFYFAVWSHSGNLLKRSTNSPRSVSFPTSGETYSVLQRRTRGEYREAFQFTELGECVLAGRPIAADLAAMRRVAWLLALAGAGVLAVGLGGGWLLISGALRPVETISAAASRISLGNLSQRINVADTDSELGRLAGVLNSTFARLEAAFAQQKHFTADASHELRTPIAVLISEAQTTLARPRTADEYRETVQVCLDTAEQMKRLTQSLLELARYDAGQEPIARGAVDLAERARAAVELVTPLARARGLRLHCELAPAPALGDAERLDQVLTNLLTNAMDYNKDEGEVRVTTHIEPGAAVLTVADTGQGIAAEDLPQVFARFWRADKSRARARGHSGLGLAIAKAIVDAHGGSIGVASELGVGTTFTVRLPR
jgi:heavy metal sensor kinase